MSRDAIGFLLHLGAAVGAAFWVVACAPTPPPVDPSRALSEGNRLFRNGQLEAAIAAYRAGYAARDPHPTLIYNLGTAYHHLGRLPEAILWYRRAAGSDDPWRRDNLALARRMLATEPLPPAGVAGWLSRQTTALRLAAVVVAWAAFVLLLCWPRVRWWPAAAVACLSLLLYGGAVGLQHTGPRPAVLLADCPSSSGELPAGTELWVRRLPDGRWQVATDQRPACPAAAVALVFPE